MTLNGRGKNSEPLIEETTQVFSKNAWYVAAWDHEITRDLQQIMVLGEKICVFRSEAGELVGLEDVRPDDEELSKMMSEDVQHAFEEDRDVLNEVQIGMANKTSPHINLPTDGGQLCFHRQLQAMINEEQQVDRQMAE